MPSVLQAQATPNNQYLVWDRLAGNFIGTWEGDALQAALLFHYHDGTAIRAGVVNPDGTVRRLLRDHATDDDGTHEGMVFEAAVDLGEREATRAKVEVGLQHHYGAWATFLAADGAGEENGPFQEAPDATAYQAFGMQPYDLTNVNGDQMEERREDYATLWIEGGAEDDPPGGVYVTPEDGLMFAQAQDWVQKPRLNRPLHSLRVRIETLRGWVRVRRLALRAPFKGFGRGRTV
jgi:hypothetical protein